jgi:hypothetical protein
LKCMEGANWRPKPQAEDRRKRVPTGESQNSGATWKARTAMAGQVWEFKE